MKHEDDVPASFAGFSRDEWIAALTGAMGRSGAEDYVRAIFSRVASDGTNGYALDVDTWARLALVNATCEDRVRVALSAYPPAVQQQVEQKKQRYRLE